MRAAKLLHDLFDDACQSIDKRLKKTLFTAADTLIQCKQLSIASLGRSLNRPIHVKHTIKCIDRLFGNRALQEKRIVFYKIMARSLLKNNVKPIIIVDWSGLTSCGAFHFLRASIAIEGRSLTLYEQAYPLKEYTSEKTHRNFLKILQSLLPEKCMPIILTDAGFRNTWFRAVLRMGWDFIGRVRNKTQYSRIGQNKWRPIKSLFEQATSKACYIGQVTLALSSPLDCHFYLMKQEKKNRVKRNLAGKKVQSSVSKKHAKSANEPWLIASSLSETQILAADIMKLYKSRMQIEEEFRDLKNTRNGFGLRHCRTFKLGRLNVALLIAALATLALWIFGTAAKQINLHYSFQANTEKRRSVLSIFTIGWQVLLRNTVQFNQKDLMLALKTICLSTVSWGEIC
jgi:hypothetical protein